MQRSLCVRSKCGVSSVRSVGKTPHSASRRQLRRGSVRTTDHRPCSSLRRSSDDRSRLPAPSTPPDERGPVDLDRTTRFPGVADGSSRLQGRGRTSLHSRDRVERNKRPMGGSPVRFPRTRPVLIIRWSLVRIETRPTRKSPAQGLFCFQKMQRPDARGHRMGTGG